MELKNKIGVTSTAVLERLLICFPYYMNYLSHKH